MSRDMQNPDQDLSDKFKSLEVSERTPGTRIPDNERNWSELSSPTGMPENGIPVDNTAGRRLPVRGSGTYHRSGRKFLKPLTPDLSREAIRNNGFYTQGNATLPKPNKDGLPIELESRHKQFKTPLNERMEHLRSWVTPLAKDRWGLTCAQLASQLA